ncbi:MAG: cobyrinate a,c-diamide synthase [Eubacterium sp.]|nr:cobyrinate a,c-diamide synthase [Eubacterium sp.]
MLKIMFAAMASDSGKTSVTCGMLALLARRGLDPCAFKCGPDYIDPMFHRSVIGVPSHNIDLYMCSKDLAKRMFERYSTGHGAAVVEGVMGYYDGLSGTSLKASACDVAETMGLPVFLIVRPKGTALTLAAQIKGMVEFRKPTHIRGIILNDSSEMYCKQMSGVIESQTGVPVIGYIPHVEGAEFKSRHLGLYTAGEIDDLTARISKLADAMEHGIDIDRLIALSTDEDVPVRPAAPQERDEHAPVIAVAKDEAFNFIYEETIDTIRDHGAQIRYFSPLHDTRIPEGASGLYIPGGYPELYCEGLEKNEAMRNSIKTAILSGMPVVAECGGFLYLGRRLADHDGVFHDMVGLLPGEAKNSGRLARFGYAELSSANDNMLLKQGETVSAHEFHYWDSTENGHDLTAGKSLTGRKWECGYARDTIYAGFPHLYMAGYPFMAERFVEAARKYKGSSR